MKKLFILLLSICTIMMVTSCSHNETPFEVATKELEKSNMHKSEYSNAEINDFENRFVNMGLEGEISRVNYFRSKTQYAYVVEFENDNDATTVYEKAKHAQYDSVVFKNTVVYGKSNWIKDLKFD